MKMSVFNNSTKGAHTIHYSQHEMFNSDITIGLTVLGVLVSILDIIGNSLVIHVVRTREHMRTTTNLLIANLATADLLMVMVVAFLIKHYFVGFDWFKGLFGHVTCKLVLSLQPICVFASVLNLTAITMDRFFAIMFPLKSFLTIKTAKRLMTAIWILSIIFSIPFSIVSKSYPLGNTHICYDAWKVNGLNYKSYVICFFIIGYLIPLITMTVMYTMMGIKLWHGSVPGVQTAEAINRIKSGRKKATKMLIAVVTAFVCCWLPLQTAELLQIFAPETYHSMPFKLHLLLPYFGIINSLVNPFIYFVFCEKFRFEFSRVLCRCGRGGCEKSFIRITTNGAKSGSSFELMTRRSLINAIQQ